jgi:hypothetical protein
MSFAGGCTTDEPTDVDTSDVIGWIYDGEEGCLEQASPQVEQTDYVLLAEKTPTLGPGGACWVLPRSQLPREGWVELDESQLPASCPDLLDIPFCGPFCPNGRLSGSRYDEDRQCLLEGEELSCRPVRYRDADVATNALAPDGTCWLLSGNQMPSDDWTDLNENPSDVCPNLVENVPQCGAQVDAGADSGLVDGDMNVLGDAQVSDGAVINAAMTGDATVDAVSVLSDGGD